MRALSHFADTIHILRAAIPGVIVEVLTPDFKGKRWCIKLVVDAHPDIYNHNIETVERLSPVVRPQARYSRTLDLLQAVTNMDASIYTKSGIMLGPWQKHMKRSWDSPGSAKRRVLALSRLANTLRPTTDKHLPVAEYIHPDQFAEYERIGDEMGFLFVASGPFVRSSYNAQEFSGGACLRIGWRL